MKTQKHILTNENKTELKSLVQRLFPNCEITKRRINSNVFDKFIGRELVIESNLWFFNK